MNIKNNLGNTVLHNATEARDIKMIELLIKADADQM